jgi:hypothetical protein
LDDVVETTTDMFALADFVVSATLVAVRTTLVVFVTVGAVYRPLEETVPTEAVQVTAVFEVFVTVAVNCEVAPEFTFALVGEIVIPTALLLFTVSVNRPRPLFPAESPTQTTKGNCPATVGTPEILPVFRFSASPEGRFCDTNRYGGVPPPTDMTAL